MESALKLEERRADKAIVLAPTGRIDLSTADQFRDSLLPLVASAAASGSAVVLDFSAVDYISSQGLRMLMLAAKQANTSGTSVVVASLQPLVREIFQISRFDKLLPCHPGMAEALATLK